MVEQGAIATWAVYAALNALLMFGLALNVGLRRGAQKQLQPGDMGDAMLTRAIRAHANFAEYAPLVLLLLLAIALLGGPPAWLHALGAGFTLGRVFQAFGMMRDRHPNAIRFIGNLTTGLALLLGAAACLWLALASGPP
ncbi:MAG TPA: MAPEG family protein [Allosphingosinicella sp.]|jgi:hypothetical protein